jgi:nitroreductase
MVRAFDPTRPVPAAVTARLLDHATRAPSAGFAQGWDFLVLDTPGQRDAFWAATAPEGPADGWLTRMRTAPLLIVCWSHAQAYRDRYAEPDKRRTDADPRRWPVPYWHTDTAMAALLMLLTAVDEGLGASFFGVPSDRVDRLRAGFGVPADRQPVGVVAVGHPAPGPRSASLRRGRRPPCEVAHSGRFGVPFDPPGGSAGPDTRHGRAGTGPDD